MAQNTPPLLVSGAKVDAESFESVLSEQAGRKIRILTNAIGDKSRFDVVEGVETYFLQKTRDAKSQRIAARENASVLQGTDKLSQDVIIDAVLNYDIEETIQMESVIITVTLQGYIKRGALSEVKQQKRGGKGKSGITTRDADSVVKTLSVNTRTSVLFFSTEGLVYKIKASN